MFNIVKNEPDFESENRPIYSNETIVESKDLLFGCNLNYITTVSLFIVMHVNQSQIRY